MLKIKSFTIKNLILPLADRAMRTNLKSSYSHLEKLSKLTKEELTLWQSKKLNELITHAYYHTSYYKQIFDDIGLSPRDVRSVNDLSLLPVLTKENIKSNFENLIPDNIQLYPFKESATGGSTGNPMTYYLDNRSWSMINANAIFNWEKTGYTYGSKFIALGSTSLFVNKKSSLKHQLYYKIKNKVGLNGINMSADVCSSYLKIIASQKIEFIYGYASSIYLLADFALKNNIKTNIKACFPTSEVLTSHYRSIIESAFQCQVLNGYGANDGGINAFEQRDGFFDVGYNSLIRIDDPTFIKEGSALITDLFNYSMPLINYNVGDEIVINEISNKSYDYNGQIINKIKGRTSDILFFPNGRSITGPGFTVLFKDIPVDYYCIEKKTSYSVICWITKLSDYTSQHRLIIERTLRYQIGEEIKIEIKTTKTPFVSKSGKRLYFIDSTIN
jgi:phenylacetate-CoA ligase